MLMVDKEEKWKQLDPDKLIQELEKIRLAIPNIDSSIKRLKQKGINPYTVHPYKRFRYRKVRRNVSACIKVLEEIKSGK